MDIATLITVILLARELQMSFGTLIALSLA